MRFPFENGTTPGISLTGDGRGCNTVSGRFDVLEVAYGPDGASPCGTQPRVKSVPAIQ